ncbi:antifreeze protein [Paenirhodobacter populi]|uniref:Antifreeze protein n=1 Tax=Paenirhodobacter populi TaxID=2306993 RepID=A0A443IPR3_9RHOB|nr:antifreeze protein [Sinirhodobacter populi]RWR08511.1 antifreeze protein [Sinirhodobacter populi]
MFSPKTSTDLFKISYQFMAMAVEAQAVIWMRLWGMAGAWNVTPSENHRMVSEKVAAAMQAQTAAAMAMMSGKPAINVAAAAVRPYRRKTSSNVSRLSKRGPKPL